ncbi:MAG: universal stress protein [bacterium]|nr:MAG: universal stress protein [bacterium]
MSRKILVPIDLSQDSDKVMAKALEFASGTNGEIILLHVVFNPSEFAGFHIPHLSTDKAREELIEDAASDVERFASRYAQGTPFRVEFGVPFREILRVAKEENVSAIVIGSHKWGGALEHLFVSHASEKVIRHAPCDILVVPLEIQSEEELMRRPRMA